MRGGGFPRNWGFPWEVESAGGPLIAGGKTMASVFFSLDSVDRKNFFSFFYSSLSRKAWSKLQNHHQASMYGYLIPLRSNITSYHSQLVWCHLSALEGTPWRRQNGELGYPVTVACGAIPALLWLEGNFFTLRSILRVPDEARDVSLGSQRGRGVEANRLFGNKNLLLYCWAQ